MKIKKKIKMICIFVFIFISSCGYRVRDDQVYLPGIYSFELPSGSYQKLEINEDYTFKQTLFSAKNGEILYENKGKLYLSGVDIKLENWLECYENDDGRYILKTEPYITTRVGPFWLKYKDSEVISIVIFDEPDYIFKKE